MNIMKKLMTIFILVLLFDSFCFSQDKGYVGISIGPSIPTGDYASAELSNQKAGLAKTGAIFDISFGYKLGKNLGLSAMALRDLGRFDVSDVEHGNVIHRLANVGFVPDFPEDMMPAKMCSGRHSPFLFKRLAHTALGLARGAIRGLTSLY